MSADRSGETGLPGLPPHQLLGLAGLVAGAGMGPTNPVNMGMHNPMVADPSASSAPASRPMPTTTVSGVGGLMGGVGGPSRAPALPQALLNMDGSGGVGWGGWGELGEGLGLERGRSRNWTYEETLELISLYTSEEWQSKFSSEKKNHRAIWAALAAALTRRKDVSGDEARQRLNNLKALYNRTRRQLLAGEISSPQWEYWEPLHVFLGRPQPYIPITSPGQPPRPQPYPFPQHHHQYHHQHHHHQGWLGALGLAAPHHAHNTTPRPLQKASPEVKLEEMPPNKETLPPAEDRGVGGGGGGGGGNGGNVEFNQNNGEEVAVGVSTGGSSPDQYQGGDGSEREPTPAPPTPTQQKPESYQLRHNNHLTLVLEALARDESFMDVTLTAQGRSLKAHKSVLSAVSPYFRGVLRDNPCQHPIIIMPRDVRFEELFSIVNYIYKGEMTVAAEDLTSLLKTAEILQVSGLAPSDSTATFNPQHETLTTGNLRSSSTSSSASSSNTPARPIRSMKQTSQRTFTPPPRPKSGDSSINPTDFMDVDMTCVKEEVTSGGEDDDAEEQIAKLPCPQSSPGDDLHHGSDAPIHDNNLPNYSLPYDQCLQQSLPSTSSTTIFRPLTSTTEALDPSTSSIKTDPDTDLNPQLCAIETAHPMRCPHCEEQHRDIDTLLTHLRIRHPTKPSFTCGCGRVFTRQAYQQAHSKLCPNAS